MVCSQIAENLKDRTVNKSHHINSRGDAVSQWNKIRNKKDKGKPLLGIHELKAERESQGVCTHIIFAQELLSCWKSNKEQSFVHVKLPVELGV